MSQTWRPLPLLRETDSVTALAVAGDVAFAGAAAGLFRWIDGAWQRLQLAATDIQAIAFGDTPQAVAAGAGSGVSVSQDGGETWTRADLETEARVTALGLNGNVVLAGTDRDGAFLSTSSGKTWARAGLDGQMVLAVSGDKLAGTDQDLFRREPGGT